MFVLTHHEREPLQLSDTTFTFATDGPEAALERARDAAGDKDVQIEVVESPAVTHLRYRVS